MKIILTGAAGFIGYHVGLRLLDRGWSVIGIDNLNAYYDVSLKESRLSRLLLHERFRFAKADISSQSELAEAIGGDRDADVIVHLAAQAGVRYSLENPLAYVDANVRAQVCIFEQARRMHRPVPVVYASSSSVYGDTTHIPFSENDRADHPLSVYAATKRAGELLAHSYGHVHSIRSTGLRFFTVYGPFGRPDMAPWLFTEAILKGEPIRVFNAGAMARDFTFVDDVAAGVVGAVDRIMTTPEATAPLYNLGGNQPIQLLDFISEIEHATGRAAIRIDAPMPATDVVTTYANIDAAAADIGFKPKTSLHEGIGRFVDWFKDYARDR